MGALNAEVCSEELRASHSTCPLPQWKVDLCQSSSSAGKHRSGVVSGGVRFRSNHRLFSIIPDGILLGIEQHVGSSSMALIPPPVAYASRLNESTARADSGRRRSSGPSSLQSTDPSRSTVFPKASSANRCRIAVASSKRPECLPRYESPGIVETTRARAPQWATG
ncbi:hypothetical protein CA85_27110 [Allorhodopirellula solitaria]|uniref:Uncharacterized protein n=1 Tax=Allorhodopirellula solitaria TaxID=2527987 RepID=A0A5C5XUN9_9BACT|nr:hypothetical protein CA85_27110 [Allorhodopirellula solitaria]